MNSNQNSNVQLVYFIEKSNLVSLYAESGAPLFREKIGRKKWVTNSCLGHILAINMVNFIGPWGSHQAPIWGYRVCMDSYGPLFLESGP